MRKLLLASAAAVLLSTPVLAADLAPMPAEPEAPAYLPFTWTGFYVGVHAGYAWGREHDDLDDRFEDSGPPPDDNLPAVQVEMAAAKFDVDGFIGGAHAGYNAQFGTFVIGLEGDVDFSGADGDHGFRAVGDDISIDGTLSLDANWQASLRARAGVALDRVLIYGTGGVAFANADLRFEGEVDLGDDPVGFDFEDGQTFVGWTIGLGAEYAFTDNIIGRLEARYTDFGDEDFDFDGPGSINVDWTQFSVLAGVSYKF